MHTSQNVWWLHNRCETSISGNIIVICILFGGHYLVSTHYIIDPCFLYLFGMDQHEKCADWEVTNAKP